MMKPFLLVVLCSLPFFLFSQKKTYLLVGTYTGGISKGIYVYQFNGGRTKLVDSAIAENPSYLALSPDQQFVYAVNELGKAQGGGRVSAYRFDKKTGKLRFLNQQSAEGEHPCYVSVDKSRRWVTVGNYSSGNVTVLPVREDGSLGKATATVQHRGRSTDQRQGGPHVHATVFSPDNRFLYVPDLGIDKLMIYTFDSQSGRLQPFDTTVKLQNGGGPRHFTFHPTQQVAYLLQELSGTVSVFKTNGGPLGLVQTISVLPADFSESFTSADLHVSPDGRFLYTSTRDKANILTIFRIDPKNGKLSLAGHQSTLGKTPRNFNLDPTGDYLLVANQGSNEIVVFSVDKNSGALSDTGHRVSVGSPVCLQWVVVE